ncbi:hypothetical protein C8034_v005832 [Colletotrichum sidae]|uniref:Uncharacterized protein n=1 Tax=Colletotrichum sidae TaxID=1347389 RepID=A0A4R8T5W8_9PEZI|nr:hypothetical protein C8034_v005832 [Colletotrichum sidae]
MSPRALQAWVADIVDGRGLKQTDLRLAAGGIRSTVEGVFGDHSEWVDNASYPEPWFGVQGHQAWPESEGESGQRPGGEMGSIIREPCHPIIGKAAISCHVRTSYDCPTYLTTWLQSKSLGQSAYLPLLVLVGASLLPYNCCKERSLGREKQESPAPGEQAINLGASTCRWRFGWPVCEWRVRCKSALNFVMCMARRGGWTLVLRTAIRRSPVYVFGLAKAVPLS